MTDLQRPLRPVGLACALIWLGSSSYALTPVQVPPFPIGPDTILAAPTPGFCDEFGYRVAVSDSWLAVGASRVCTSTTPPSGSVFVYPVSTAGELGTPQELSIASPTRDIFGDWIAIGEDRLIITAPQSTNGAPGQVGSVHAFELDPSGTWVAVADFHSTITTQETGFGRGLALDGDRFAFGEPADPSGGRIHIAERQADGSWSLAATIANPAGEVLDSFGVELSLEGDTLLAGARRTDTPTPGDGLAYVYERDSTGNWALIQTLANPDPVPAFGFGWDVELEGDDLVISAVSLSNGFVFTYERQPSGLFSQVGPTLENPDLGGGSRFGWSLGLHEERLVVSSLFGSGVVGQAAITSYRRRADGTWHQVAYSDRSEEGTYNLNPNCVAIGARGFALGAPEPADSSQLGGRAFWTRHEPLRSSGRSS